MTHPDFNEAAWIERLAADLEQVAAEAEPSYSPPPPAIHGLRPVGEYWSALHRGYRSLAERAKHDPTASIQFKASRLRVETDPVDAIDILRGHPLIEPGLRGSGKSEEVVFRILNGGFSSTSKGLVASLAKLSVKEGGEEAARRLHRYLAAGANGTVPAYEITVIHGLVVKTRFNLDAGASLAPVRGRQSGVRPARRTWAAVADELPRRGRASPRPRIWTRCSAARRLCRSTRCAGRLPLPC